MSNIECGRLSHRAVAMLRATAAGRAELTCSCEPDLRVDSLPCCDQTTTRLLFHSGLIRAAENGTTGQWIPAELTPAGMNALAQLDDEALLAAA